MAGRLSGRGLSDCPWSCFFVVEVVVVVGGASDIKDMFASLREHAARDVVDS